MFRKTLFARYLTLLVLALLSTNLAWGTDVDSGTSKFTTVSGDLDENIAYSAAKAGGTTAPVTNNSNIRLYRNNSKTAALGSTLTITPKNGVTITSVTFTLKSSLGYSYSVDGGSAQTGTNNSITISNISATKSVVLQNNSTSQMDVTRIQVTYSGGTTKTLISVAVSGNPTKTTYEAGEEFDPAGLVVTGTYSEGDPEVITSGITWSSTPNPLTAGTTSVSVKATVGNIESPEYVVNGLTVKEFVQTYANTYTSDASLSSVITGSKVKWDGCKVTDGYDALKIAKGSTATITVPAGTKTVHLHLVAWNGESAAFAVKLGEASLSSITPTANTGVANNSPFTLTTEPKTENSYYFAIEVNADEETTLSLTASSNKRAILFGVNFEAAKERTLQSITVKTDPNKILYKVGESFDPTGLVVTGTFDNGDIEDLPESKYSLSTPAMSSAGQKTVTVSATDEIKTTFTIDVVALDKIEITTAPNKTEYNEGDNFDPEGMVVKGTWGTEEGKIIFENNLTGYTVTDGTNLQPTQTYVTVSYTHAETTKTATQDITVTAAANKYAVTFTNVTEEGTLTVKVGDEEITTGTELVEGVIVSLTSTPNSGYKQHSTPFVVKDADGVVISLKTENGQKYFEMPAKAVTITAQFSKVYKINVVGDIQHGIIKIQDKDGKTITETSQGSKVVVAVTPDEHYSLSSLYYIKEGEETHIDIEAKEGVYSFSMVANNVTVYATFAEDAKYTVTFSVNGIIETKSNYADEAVEFPTPSSIDDYVFMGWTEKAIARTQTDAPDFVETATYPANNDKVYYAVFAKKSGSENYVKVTSAPTDWSGEYLLVYEGGENANVAWTGVDVASCNVEVTISNGTITTKPDNAVTLTIASMTGGYSIKVNGGDNNDKYIDQTSYANGLAFKDDPSANTLSYSDNSTVIAGSGASGDSHVTMRYNSASDQKRFRYYKSGQEAIALYKKQEATFSNYCTTVSGQTIPVTIKSSGIGSFCSTVNLDFTNTGVNAYIAVSTDNEKITLNKRNKIPAGTGIFVKGDPDTYDIHTTTEECDDVTGNLLKGTIVPYTVKTNDIWVLSSGKLHPVQVGVTIGAGKAYLKESLEAASLSLFIVDEPTGVEEIKSQSTVNSQQSTAIFNLQGMRVSTPKKGEVYIMNGKKFLMK